MNAQFEQHIGADAELLDAQDVDFDFSPPTSPTMDVTSYETLTPSRTASGRSASTERFIRSRSAEAEQLAKARSASNPRAVHPQPNTNGHMRPLLPQQETIVEGQGSWNDSPLASPASDAPQPPTRIPTPPSLDALSKRASRRRNTEPAPPAKPPTPTTTTNPQPPAASNGSSRPSSSSSTSGGGGGVKYRLSSTSGGSKTYDYGSRSSSVTAGSGSGSGSKLSRSSSKRRSTPTLPSPAARPKEAAAAAERPPWDDRFGSQLTPDSPPLSDRSRAGSKSPAGEAKDTAVTAAQADSPSDYLDSAGAFDAFW